MRDDFRVGLHVPGSLVVEKPEATCKCAPLERREYKWRWKCPTSWLTLVESLAQRVEALEVAHKPEDDAGGQEDPADAAPASDGRGRGLFGWRRMRQSQGDEKSDG